MLAITAALALALPATHSGTRNSTHRMLSGSSISTPSLELLLGRATHSPGYALVSLSTISIDSSHDQDWFSHGDPYAWVTIQPSGLRFESKALHDSNSGDLAMNFYVPLTATSATIQIYDEDPGADDKIGELTMQLSHRGSFQASVITQQRDWLMRLRDVTAGTISGYVAVGQEAEARAQAINSAGIEVVEAWTPVLDPNSVSSYWNTVTYQAGQLHYLVGGTLLDEEGKPGSGLWNVLEGRRWASDPRLATGPGADTTSVIGNAYVREAMANLGTKLSANDRFRRNELGVNFMNSVIWPEKPNHGIGLGDNAIDHARVRKVLDKIVGPAMASTAATRHEVVSLAEDFWFNPVVDTDTNVQVFTQKLLHKFMLNMILSQAEAEEFAAYKTKILIVAGAPESTACSIPGFDCTDINRWKAAKLVLYQSKLESAYPTDMSGLTALEKIKLTSNVLDALLFAGGVSVPTVIQNAFAVLYGEWGQGQLGTDFVLTEADLTKFVLEVIRRFPPVAGFPTWDRQTNQHVMIDLFMANLDERDDGWGPTARDFKLRSLADYHTKLVAWADQALVNNDNAHASSRVCPAKDLSIVMVTEFLRAYLRHGGQSCWMTTQTPSSVTIDSYGASTVSLTHVCTTSGSLFSDDKLHELGLLVGSEATSSWWSGLLSGISTPDTRMDAYSRVLALANSVAHSSHVKATAAAVTVPTARQNIPGVPCGLTNITVPETDEHQGDVSTLNRAGGLVGNVLDFPETADISEVGDWDVGEDPEAMVKDMVGVWPDNRGMYDWGTGSGAKTLSDSWPAGDRYSDAVVQDLVMAGLGQHRLERVKIDDTMKPSNAKYAVYLNFAETLEVRPGFAKLGADAYFDENGVLIAIARGGSLFTPNGPQGTPSTCTRSWSWGRWTSSCTTPTIGWRHAKLAFRGTLITVVTAIDHLYGSHLTAGNALVTANVEELEANHPLRRLMTPFGYRTEAINYNAAILLAPEWGMLHRGAALSTNGLTTLWHYANVSSRGLTWQPVPAKKAARGVDLQLPYDVDGLDYYQVLKNYTHYYLAHYYDLSPPAASGGADACAADPAIQRWYARVDSLLPATSDLPGLSCAVLEDVLSTFMYHVSAYHRHVGSIASEAADPCFAPMAWREGELCGPPRTMIMQGLIMATTGLEMPTILEDYTHMFLDAPAQQMWLKLSADLRQLGRTVNTRNQGRSRPFTVFDSEHIETSVGI